MSSKSFTTFFIFFALCLFSKGQPNVFENEFKTSFNTKPKFEFKFDSRFSFLRNTNVKTTGIKIGLSFNKKFNVGLGFNQLFVNAKSEIIEQADTIPVNLNYFYFSPYFEYVYFTSKKWEFNLSTQIGLGSAKYNYTNFEGKEESKNRTTILSYEPAMLIDYKIIKWVGLGLGVGYRLVFYKNGEVKEHFSSPIYVIKLKVYLGSIVQSISGKQIPAE
ncbi:MAG: hypothetical protein COW67_09985 [Flavobacteriales bacterium CG18_big_fil_WC_8_21_14_2_50_32_9]|nr:hypothetical protein [Flavobacteriales bacterium]PIQ15132.1 MAG: hypothetical protein COW67_09985 [Flavobacteriales bacterium CG18_big_fil_WC_8_21_14_2_50_32_9]